MTDEEFSFRALKASLRSAPYESTDTIMVRGFFGFPRVSTDFGVQVVYWRMRLDGQSHNMAEMLATRSFPGTRGTDRAFMQGRPLDGSQFEGLPRWLGEDYVRKAEAAGVNPAGKYYSGPLAAYPGDPRAWVDSLSDVRKIAEERNLDVQGALTHVARETPPPTGPYRPASDIVERYRREGESPEDASSRLAGAHGAK